MTLAAALAVLLGSSALAAPVQVLYLEAREATSFGGDEPGAAATFYLRRESELGTMPGKSARAVVRGGMRTWQLQIFDRDEKKVAFVQGRGEPPSGAIRWEGKDARGNQLPNGFYSARLVWTDEDNKFHKSSFVTVGKLSLDDMREFLGPYVSLNRAGEGFVFRVRDRFVFDTSESSIREDSLPYLDRICRFLRAGAGSRIVVHGAQSQEEARLSEPRRRALLAYLAEQSVEASKLDWR